MSRIEFVQVQKEGLEKERNKVVMGFIIRWQNKNLDDHCLKGCSKTV